MSDQKYFDQVAEELRSSGPHEGVWLRAVTECGGDEEKARVVYVRLRVEQLKSQEKDEDSIAKSSYFRQNPQQLFDIRQRAERRKRTSLIIIAAAFLLFASLLVLAVIAGW